MEIAPDTTDAMHRLVTSIVAPRPIAWVSTDHDGQENLAPYSYFNAVSSRPPVVMVSARGRGDGSRKDTARNALSSGEFVVNLVTEDLATEMVATSEEFGADTSEFDAVGVERTPATTVVPPRVAEARAALECTVYDHESVYEHSVIYGEVSLAYVDPEITTDGKVDAEKVDSVGRLGGPFYTGVTPTTPPGGHESIEGLPEDMFED
jgi:flavin reductase (DIM6/NTAB) family NADH-FMN oxidoreductase RutF